MEVRGRGEGKTETETLGKTQREMRLCFNTSPKHMKGSKADKKSTELTI